MEDKEMLTEEIGENPVEEFRIIYGRMFDLEKRLQSLEEILKGRPNGLINISYADLMKMIDRVQSAEEIYLRKYNRIKQRMDDLEERITGKPTLFHADE